MVISTDQIPAQAQEKQPAHEHEMTPSPIFDRDSWSALASKWGRCCGCMNLMQNLTKSIP